MSESSILYCDKDNTVLVIDIPRSIEEQQVQDPPARRLISSVPLQQPWPSNEPKTQDAREKLPRPSQHDQETSRRLHVVLDTTRSAYPGPYCLPRIVTGVSEKPEAQTIPPKVHGKKRSASADTEARVHVLDASNAGTQSSEVGQILYHNPLATASWHKFRDVHASVMIPARSSFYQGDCSDSRGFHQAVHELASLLEQKARFDLVVMDPPWQNASIRRGKQKGQAHYQVQDSGWDMRQLLFGMDLAPLLDKEALVTVWITNKQAVRDLVLSEEDGLFESWGVELIEEWTWLKITSAGDPVLRVDGILRKPYEVLLIGLKRASHHEAAKAKTIKHRTMLAVPDVHSRKPNVKKMFIKVFGLGNDHRGLEVFARNLTSGWHAWGNQVTEFASEKHWPLLAEDGG